MPHKFHLYLIDYAPQVVMALDDHDMYEQERRQSWHKGATKWAQDCPAPILAVDPVPNTAAHAKASLLPGLPIWHAHNTAGKVYLVRTEQN